MARVSRRRAGWKVLTDVFIDVFMVYFPFVLERVRGPTRGIARATRGVQPDVFPLLLERFARGAGRPNRKPCIQSMPRRPSACIWAGVSMPSATSVISVFAASADMQW